MILQRYIFRELLGSFVFAFRTVLTICLIGMVFQIFRAFPGLGVELVAKALPVAVGTMSGWVMLVASCTSCTLVYARLAAENEITAMRTCGIHIWRVIAPALFLGLLLVLFAYPLNEIVVPWARMGNRMILRESSMHVLKSPPAGAQDFKIGLMRITYTDFLDGKMVKPIVSKFALTKEQQYKPVMQWVAPSGMIVAEGGALKIIMTSPQGWRTNERGQEETFGAEGDVVIEVPPERTDVQRQNVDKPSEQLWELSEKARGKPAERNPLLLILHTRYAASLAPLLLVLVSVPIGILVRRGSRLAGLGASLPPLLIYFVCYFLFQGLGDKNRVPPYLAAYAPDLFLGVLALLLLWGVSRR